ncbi:MAG: hypothetical protein AB7S75_24225 [Desulfococcaceae bacterium]
MSRKNSELTADDGMQPEYDFSKMKGGVRCKYAKAFRAGHTVNIHKAYGTTEEQYFEPENGI